MGIHQATNPTIHSVTYPTAEPDSYPDTLGHTSGHQVTNPVTGQAVHPATDPTIHRAIDPYTHQDTTGQPITIETWHPFTAIQGKILFSLIAAGGRTSRQKISKETGIKLASIKRTTALLVREGYICNVRVYYGHNERGFTYSINQAVCAEFIARVSNQTLKIVRKMFNFAVERDILQHTPCTGVKALAPNNSRERTLNEAEIKALWANLDAGIISDEIKRALKLILVTAQRPGEVIGMRAAEIDKRWWTIPSERAKNGRAQRVYLTNLAVSLIGDSKGKDFLFPCPHKKKVKQIEAHAVGVAVRRNLAWPVTDKNGKPLFDADGNPVTENKLGIEQFTPHDLRRTAATFLAKMGNMDEVIDAVLNHAKQGVIKVYNQYRYDAEKQKALEVWERKLNSIISGTKSNVVSIAKRKNRRKPSCQFVAYRLIYDNTSFSTRD